VKGILYDWGGLNVALFHAINGWHATWLDQAMAALTWAGDHRRFPVYLAALALVTWLAGTREAALPGARLWLLALATYAIGYLIDGLLVMSIKSALDFPRPPAALPAGSFTVIGEPETHHSLPSGHASFAMLTGAVLWTVLRNAAARTAIALYVLAVCLSRVYLGAHFPADVVYGALKSLLVAIAVRSALARLAPARRD